MKIKKADGMMILFGLVFFLIGVCMIIGGIVSYASEKSFRANAETTTAVITDIETYRTRSNGKTRTRHDVYIEYEVDGQRYDRELNHYTAGMHVGQHVEVYYNPDDPGDARAEADFAYGILGIMGLIFGLIGGSFLFTIISSKIKFKRLLENGERLTGTITDVITITNVRINGRHPFKAECTVEDVLTGEKYLYSSQQVTTDISFLIGSTVDVYVDPDDKSKYFIDLDSADGGYSDVKVHDYR